MHSINYPEYHCSVSEKKILADLNQWAYDPQETSGYHGMMTFHRDIVCKNREEAREQLEKLERCPYDDHAVMFKDSRKKYWMCKVEYHC